ncbi:MAG: 5'/3'-nucleotidase SurE [Erythrobacter sp.]
MNISTLSLVKIAVLCASALVSSGMAHARNILITNDDGLTSNVVALHAALTQAGHDVIVSVPCQNQSGTGAAIVFDRPLVPLVQPCRHDAAKAGDPAVGPIMRPGVTPGEFYYVDGTPVMALLHGLHVASKERWGGQPDLVLSGPNEGQNVGAIVISSGTLGAAQAAALEGIPAIALSAGANTDGPDLEHPVSTKVAELSAQLVAALEEAAGDGPMLPRGLALNVNFPDDPAGAEWRLTKIGTYNAYRLGFTMNMARDASPTMKAMAAARGAELPELPGLTFEFATARPTEDQMQDESVVYRKAIAISPMRAGFEADTSAQEQAAALLGTLLSSGTE